jgi:hypothetical protein
MHVSKRSHEGYLLIDNRTAGGVLLESATITCSHCQCVVVLNPDRSRSRGYCPKCDHYVCDGCEAVRGASGECRPFERIIAETQERGLRQHG